MNPTAPAPTPRPACNPIRAAAKLISYRGTIDVIGGSNYFKGSQVAPVIDPSSGHLVVTDGWGERRYWGTPYCHADLTWLTPKIVQIDLRWGHKHNWGKPSFYYRYDSKTRNWTKLTKRNPNIKALLAVKFSPPPGILIMPSVVQPLETDLELA